MGRGQWVEEAAQALGSGAPEAEVFFTHFQCPRSATLLCTLRIWRRTTMLASDTVPAAVTAGGRAMRVLTLMERPLGPSLHLPVPAYHPDWDE